MPASEQPGQRNAFILSFRRHRGLWLLGIIGVRVVTVVVPLVLGFMTHSSGPIASLCTSVTHQRVLPDGISFDCTTKDGDSAVLALAHSQATRDLVLNGASTRGSVAESQLTAHGRPVYWGSSGSPAFVNAVKHKLGA
ncbi:hypothetical protein [Rugosimonospora africana]|uniref:Uncharacterized protein n=1 Tax=Rugosimonospora africana TaxID=556532 RepID=A0A8J3VMJ5_9ACTN|nr:hypothetical protein [Rugosimonospora africana]GIH12070.1 hypothetical protein Raf01_02420 [Rugosimonospora africana]